MDRNQRVFGILFIVVILGLAIGITIQGAAQRKNGSSSSTATKNVSSVGVNCARSLAYWAAHPERYPVSIVIGDQRYRRDQIASTLAGADPAQELLRQVVVAFLNSAADGRQTTVDGTLVEAYQWLVAHPAGVGLVDLESQDQVRLISSLAGFNEGQAGLASCDGMPTSTPTVLPTATLAPTSTNMPTVTGTLTPTPSPTSTILASPTSTGTPTLTGTPTASGSLTPTGNPTSTATPTLTLTPTALVTYSGGATPTATRARTERVSTKSPTNPPRPTTLTPKPTTLTPKPTTLTPKPTTLTPRPTTRTPASPGPTSKTPVPGAFHGGVNPQSPVPTATLTPLFIPTQTPAPGRASASGTVQASSPKLPVSLVRFLIITIRTLDRDRVYPKGR